MRGSLIGTTEPRAASEWLARRRGVHRSIRRKAEASILGSGGGRMSREYVEKREGNYFVKGSRVSLDSLVYGFLNGESPETIRDNFPSVTLEQVFGAIAFYLAHETEIDLYLRRKKEAFDEAHRLQARLPTDLRARLDQAKEKAARRI